MSSRPVTRWLTGAVNQSLLVSPRGGRRDQSRAPPRRRNIVGAGLRMAVLRSPPLPRADARTKRTLALFGAATSSSPSPDGAVNRRGSELVYELHWLAGVIATPTRSPESLRRLPLRTRRPLTRQGSVNRAQLHEIEGVSSRRGSSFAAPLAIRFDPLRAVGGWTWYRKIEDR